MDPRKKDLVDDIMMILQLRMKHSQSRYPNNGRLQHLDQLGYLVGIISECALADSMVHRHLYRILHELKKRS